MTECTRKLLSTSLKAEFLGVSDRTLERLKAEGRDRFPKPIEIDGQNYFDPVALEEFKSSVELKRRTIHPLELEILTQS